MDNFSKIPSSIGSNKRLWSELWQPWFSELFSAWGIYSGRVPDRQKAGKGWVVSLSYTAVGTWHMSSKPRSIIHHVFHFFPGKTMMIYEGSIYIFEFCTYM